MFLQFAFIFQFHVSRVDFLACHHDRSQHDQNSQKQTGTHGNRTPGVTDHPHPGFLGLPNRSGADGTKIQKCLKVFGEGIGGAITIPGVLAQTLQADSFEVGGAVSGKSGYWLRINIRQQPFHFSCCFSDKGQTPRDHFVQDNTKGINIGRWAGSGGIFRLLGRHVQPRAHGLVFHGFMKFVGGIRVAGQSEVGNFQEIRV